MSNLSNVVSGKVEKIRENKEHLVPKPFTLNNNDRKFRMVSVCFFLFQHKIDCILNFLNFLHFLKEQKMCTTKIICHTPTVHKYSYARIFIHHPTILTHVKSVSVEK